VVTAITKAIKTKAIAVRSTTVTNIVIAAAEGIARIHAGESTDYRRVVPN
jgi:hypothetical protein